MTSAVSREDIEDELYRAGIRSKYILSRLMRMIEVYAISRAREIFPLEDVPIPPGSVLAGLLPGEHDLERKVTRCKQCGIPKGWHLFGKDASSVTGHRVICRSCIRGPHHPPLAYEAKKWYCPACGRKKPPQEFPPEKNANPRIRQARCNDCGGMPPA